MAFFALGDGVHTDQRKAGQVMIEQHVMIPAFLVMAAAALFTLLAVVDIIFCVTAVAVLVQFFLVYITAVALVAVYFLMFAEQGEVGLPAVIELRFLPGRLVVAILAFAPILPLMSILILVAVVTLFWQR